VSVGADVAHEGPGGASPPTFTEVPARSPLQLFWRRLRADKVALGALGFIVLLVLLAFPLAPVLLNALGLPGPTVQNLDLTDSFGDPFGPSREHPFGVDDLGRDVFARVLYGARASLLVALVATLISVGIGVVLGMTAGFFRGWVDTAISRVIDVLLAFPVLLLGIGLASSCSLGSGCLSAGGLELALLATAGAVMLAAAGTALVRRTRGREVERAAYVPSAAFAGVLLLLALALAILFDRDEGVIKPGLTVVIFVIAFVNWTYIARIIRGQVLSLRETQFVEAARAHGASNMRILFREILPNLVAPIIVYSTLILPTNVLFEAALSFLGVGVQPPQPSWGAMIADAIKIFDTAWWYMLFPGLALLFTVLAFNLLGDGLQDALNPRTEES
jgi:ABC-type dipeptide/oligopeptide/nickel transport system permease subunit